MCGIAGIVNTRDIVDQAVLQNMVSAIAHRGPNHAASQVEHHSGLSVGFGYRRLSIIDLSSAGNQPMINETGDVRIIYNGELYNHPALRRELEAKGHRYCSHSDTETVLHAYEEWGTEAFARFNGMFAFALYDERTNSLILARDRRGIKPLYYSWNGHTLAFASELKALLKADIIQPNIDPTALWLFLCLGYVPSPHCIVAGANKLEPGSFLELREGKIQIVQYAQENSSPDIRVDEHEAIIHVRESIEKAVQRQLMSDVPVGVFLSGGLDSTIIATLASRYHPKPLHTFSVGYAQGADATKADSRYNDDFFFARPAAKNLRTIHHEVLIENGPALTDLFVQLCFQLDEPMVEPVFLSTHYLSQLARRHDVPVILTGDGADELFGGYDRYFAAKRLALYQQIPGLGWLLPFVEGMGSSLELGRSARELRYLLGHRSSVEGYIRFSTIFRPNQALQLLHPALRSEVDIQSLRRLVDLSLDHQTSFADQMGYRDLVLWVGEHFNPRLDRISMLHSVEARVPFQDNEVVDVALSIPMSMKTKRQSRKGLLKKAFADIIPLEARTRPKRSFQAPGMAWLQGGLNDSLQQLISGDTHLSEIFDQVQVRHYASVLGHDTPGQIFSVSALLFMDLWVRQHSDNSAQHEYVKQIQP
jgi:asparagine synthase (glutamine-hydrolysing)